MSLDLKSYTDRITQSYTEQKRTDAEARVVAALRSVPPGQRESVAQAAIKRLATQEQVEVKIKQLSEEGLDKLLKQLG